MSFARIKGQERPIKILQSYIRSHSAQGAYLFSGPDGTGKYLAAKTFAKALNCFSLRDDACEACASCLKINKDQHPDVHSLESDGHEAIKIDQIRQLKREISLRPYEGRKKVFILNFAHNLTGEAQNALLKVMEEPPQHSLIILVAAKPALLFKTVLSRCKTVRFYPMPKHELEETLKNEYNIEQAAARFLARFCEGRFGMAMALKDTEVIRSKNKVIDEFIFSGARLLEGRAPQDKVELASSLNLLMTWFRDIYLFKAGASESDVVNSDRNDELVRSAARYSFGELDGIIRNISDSLLYLEQNVNPKLLLSNLKVQLWRK